jgi:hypothetical protein
LKVVEELHLPTSRDLYDTQYVARRWRFLLENAAMKNHCALDKFCSKYITVANQMQVWEQLTRNTLAKHNRYCGRNCREEVLACRPRRSLNFSISIYISTILEPRHDQSDHVNGQTGLFRKQVLFYWPRHLEKSKNYQFEGI